MKRIGEVFSDYDAGKDLSAAIVNHVTLKKRSKTLEIEIASERYIEIEQIEALKGFVNERFSLNDSKIIVKYTEEVNMKPLEEEIQSILRMLSRKHPILKGTVNDCTYVINNSSIDINFNVIISQIFKDLKYSL